MCMTKAAWEQMLFSVDFHLDRQEKQRAACLAARNILEHDISARQKQVLLLYYGEGKKMADIAQLLGVNISTVSRTHRRACAAVQKRPKACGLL